MEEKIYYIYCHIRLDINQVFYIGKGSYSLKDSNKYKRAYMKRGRNSMWNRVVKKSEYKVKILDEYTVEEDCFNREIELISFYGRKNNKTGILCNLTDGGEGICGLIFTQSHIENIRLSKIGKWSGKNNPKYKKGSFGKDNPFYGKKHSKKTKEILSKQKKGKKMLIETKVKISESVKGEGNPMFGKNHTEESKRKISEKAIHYHKNNVHHFKGKKFSKDHLEKLSKARKGLLCGERNPNYGKKGEMHHCFGLKMKEEVKQKMRGENNKKSNIILDTETGIYYFGFREVAECIDSTSDNVKYRLRRKNDLHKFKIT